VAAIAIVPTLSETRHSNVRPSQLSRPAGAPEAQRDPVALSQARQRNGFCAERAR
jgi:hypothetical protein